MSRSTVWIVIVISITLIVLVSQFVLVSRLFFLNDFKILILTMMMINAGTYGVSLWFRTLRGYRM